MSDDEPTVVDNPDASRFELYLEGELAGFAEYRHSGDTERTHTERTHTERTHTEFTHTEIDPRFEGRGLGSILGRSALDQTRAAGRAAIPYCPFIRRYISRHLEYLDLVPAAQRAKFDLPAAVEPAS